MEWIEIRNNHGHFFKHGDFSIEEKGEFLLRYKGCWVLTSYDLAETKRAGEHLIGIEDELHVINGRVKRIKNKGGNGND